MINEAHALKGYLGEWAQGVANSFHNFFDGLDSTASEDVTSLGDLPVPRKILSPRAGGSSSSPKLVNQFPAPSVVPTRRQAIYMSIPEDARVLFALVGIASYLRYLVTEEDQIKINEVEAPWLFNEAQQTLNRASLLHHEAFLRYREESKRHEAETQDLAEKKDTYKLLNEKLQAELEAAWKEHTGLLEQAQKRLDQVWQLQAEVDAVKAKAKQWKKNMDRLASEKETARAQLASAEVQLRAAKKNSAKAKTIDELQFQLSLAISGLVITEKVTAG
ncbi:uncharacterized protein [Nicotiana tomentosiformis]|nr:uncharacterized protein LOC104100732 isoform X2 [Nicotiana tomentosiformis]